MGQLSSRLRELVVLYGQDDRAWQPQIDQLAHLEGQDPKAAHDRFESLRKELAHGRFHALRSELVATPFLSDVPSGDLRGADLKEVGREIDRLELAVARARAIRAALAEAAAGAASLERRRAAPDLARFGSVAFPRLGEAAEEAESVRRAVASEARAEERYRRARSRAGRLSVAKVDVPDLSSAAVPDPAAAHAALDALEPALDAAERVEDLLAKVRKALKDAAVRDHKPHLRRLLGERAEREATDADRGAAARALEATLEEAGALREYAAKRAEDAARARRRGLRGPERERRSTDMQDPYG